ncbi:hypothetical protein C0992_001567 [Termitomyces sp. T32_za158]|nr:hypothetical protein C0992_001567 [Termitomyces sp. T32_za158]
MDQQGETPAMGPAWANLHQRQCGMYHQEWDRPRPPLAAETQDTSPVVEHHVATTVAGRATSQKNAKRHECKLEPPIQRHWRATEEPAHNSEEVPHDVEEQSAVDDVESVQIDGDEYVAVDVYDNDYYARDDKEEHMFALTKHQGDGRVRMRRVTLQKAADKLQ